MTVFADSSAIVKRYADEEHSSVVRTIDVMVVSALARVEVVAALWRKTRTKELSVEFAATLAAEFTADWAAPEVYVAVAVTEAIVEDATRQVARHGLRAYDGVQLASLLAARAADPGLDTFACFDAELRTAAAREGLRPLPV